MQYPRIRVLVVIRNGSFIVLAKYPIFANCSQASEWLLASFKNLLTNTRIFKRIDTLTSK